MVEGRVRGAAERVGQVRKREGAMIVLWQERGNKEMQLGERIERGRELLWKADEQRRRRWREGFERSEASEKDAREWIVELEGMISVRE